MTPSQLMLQPLRRYVDFQGRSARQEYWLWVLLMAAAAIVFAVLINTIGAPVRIFGYSRWGGWSWRGAVASYGPVGVWLIGLRKLFLLATFLPSLAVAVRRLHDTGKSGWWVLIGLIPVLGWIVMLILTVIDGTPGPNAYGPDPKGRDAVDSPS